MSKNTYKAEKFTPLGDKVFVTDLESGTRKTPGGIVIPDDDMKLTGIRHRWCKVWKVGPLVDDLKIGQWVLVEHGRWTNGIELEIAEGEYLTVWRIDYPTHSLVVSDVDPRDHEHLRF